MQLVELEIWLVSRPRVKSLLGWTMRHSVFLKILMVINDKVLCHEHPMFKGGAKVGILAGWGLPNLSFSLGFSGWLSIEPDFGTRVALLATWISWLFFSTHLGRWLASFIDYLQMDLFLSVVTMWWRATFELRFWIFKATFLNLSMKSLNNSPFSCRILTRAINVMWCGRFVANWFMNFASKVSK